MAVDCHIHMVLDGVDWRCAIGRHRDGVDKAWVREVLRRYRERGFVYLRDGGDRWGVSQFARSVAPEYGIVYRTPLAPISKKSRYGGFIGQQYEDVRDYVRLIREHREGGADFIKLMISGLMDLRRFGGLTEPGMDPGELRQLVYIAREEGFRVMVHANGARTVEAAAAAGVDSVEHGAYLDRAALCAMVENRTVWVPTLSTLGNLPGVLDDAPADPERYDPGAVRQILALAMENIRHFRDMGGKIAPGSDAGAWAVCHGQQDEDKLLLAAGLTEQEIQDGAAEIRARF